VDIEKATSSTSGGGEHVNKFLLRTLVSGTAIDQSEGRTEQPDIATFQDGQECVAFPLEGDASGERIVSGRPAFE
jgi:hypothetical protein